MSVVCVRHACGRNGGHNEEGKEGGKESGSRLLSERRVEGM